MRHIAWFSCGSTSAITAKMTLERFPDAVIAYLDTGAEHEDNKRFMADCAKWYGKEIIVLKSEKYADLDAVLATGYINGVYGAMCTRELKRKVAEKFLQPNDIEYLGFHHGEEDRAFEWKQRYGATRKAEFPLIDGKITKQECIFKLIAAGIKLPAMYDLGYQNNNCIGCVKGGMGYWNKIRKDFPDVFKKRSEQERKAGHSCIKGVFLDELPEGRGRYKQEFEIQCDIFCGQDNEMKTQSEVSNG